MEEEELERWYVLRDLKRANASDPGYRVLERAGFEVFMPLELRPSGRAAGGPPPLSPAVRSLVFVRGTRSSLDPVLSATPTLQYLFARGARRTPVTVPGEEMERFVRAARSGGDIAYYAPEEVSRMGRLPRVRVSGGALDGCEGELLSSRGSRTRRLLVRLAGYFSAGVRIEPGSAVRRAGSEGRRKSDPAGQASK